ncbi:MAG TPA: hypothetical protein ACFYD6_02530 [Candidatus Brocadiia bacterium]|nr:hypothetical protein [Planctomycetota bacterium]MBI4006875.1 hypothetical protein [Planctomycetota bacterium]MDO8092932.1 hypothetical protein [Candidatus Brocadiales bacterium]
MKMVQEKREKEREARKNIALLTGRVEDAQINEISKELFLGQIVKKGKDWICPVCYRPHHKKPGPFTCGITVHRNERTVSLWARALNCCRWEQYFPFEKIKERKVEASNLNPVLKRIFYPK